MENSPTLVTSALEETWPDSGRILFAGSWCLRYSRRHIWKERDYDVLPYHWDDRSRIPSDLATIRQVYESLLAGLVPVLNGLHGTNHSLRYWRIVLGWWLYYFTQVCFDRWTTLRIAADYVPAVAFARIPTATRVRASSGMDHFIMDATTDEWNERLFADIAALMSDFTVADLPGKRGFEPSPEETAESGDLTAGPLGWVRRRLRPGRRDRLSSHADYLTSRAHITLMALAHQRPSLSPEVPSATSVTDASRRGWTLPSRSEASDLEGIISALIPAYLPTAYLEAYQANVLIAGTAHFPKRPAHLFTSNAFVADEVWKLYAAGQVEMGAKLTIQQHGGHYGLGAWNTMWDHELSISERYLTWGWHAEGEPSIRPSSSARLFSLGGPVLRASRNCYLVTAVHPRYSYWLLSSPIGPQWESYLRDQFRFVAALGEHVQPELLVRTYPDDFGWDQNKRWADQFPSIRIEEPKTSMLEGMRSARLFIGTYNATTFLESIYLDVPTVFFWDPEYWECSTAAAQVLTALEEAEVFFRSPEACASHVNEIWENVDTWWHSAPVAAAVSGLMAHYARVDDKPVQSLLRSVTAPDL